MWNAGAPVDLAAAATPIKIWFAGGPQVDATSLGQQLTEARQQPGTKGYDTRTGNTGGHERMGSARAGLCLALLVTP